MFKRVPSIEVPTIRVPSIGVPMIGVRGRGEKREPSPYIELPYIVSNGNSWADTGLYLDPTIHRVQGSIIVDDIFGGGSLALLEGSTYEQLGIALFALRLSSSSYSIYIVQGNTVHIDIAIFDFGREYQFDITPEYVEIDGIKIEHVAEGVRSQIPYYIGNTNMYPADPTAITASIRGTKRVFSVYATGEIIGLSTPTLAKETDIFDYFDKVSGKYLENKGSEPWTGAYESWVYQMGRPLSYLKSDGNQWIDTKINPIIGEDSLKINYAASTIDQFSLVLGNGTGGEIGLENSSFYNSVGKLGYVYKTGDKAVIKYSDILLDTNEHTLERIGREVFIDGVLIQTIVGDPVQSELPLFLFATNRTAGVYGKFKGYITALEYNGKELLLPFITWEGVKGYLNLVNRELLLNQGTGEFEVPTIPVYAINWQDETFDPIVGKVAQIGTSYTTGLGWNDWTDTQKQTFRGKKIKMSWKLSANEAVIGSLKTVGFSGRVYYTDEEYMAIQAYETLDDIFSGLESPYSLSEDYSLSKVVQIADKDINTISKFQPQFFLPRIQSGELKAYDIKWEVDVPEYEIEAIETLNDSGIAAQADYQDNINTLNQIGII